MDELKLLSLIEKDGRLTPAQLAGMLGEDEAEVAAVIKKHEEAGTILSYPAVIDWERTDRELVTALIEVKVVPQRGEGFDRVAARIYQYKEVDSVYLMSGGFDLMLLIEGTTMKEVALFVAQKLAVMESVSATATHFVLKKYKDKGVVFVSEANEDRRTPIV
ncbi:MAG: Lrp/AsnC family transcriptional regulator [Clostridia bacterium]|nr:Lrp/AsnC family transcriptional regulator [Clostridia bacterium]